MLRPQLRNWQIWDFGLLFLGLATQIYFFLWNPYRSLVGDENYYWSNALAWAHGQPLQEHPFWPPGQIRWLGLWIGILGPTRWLLAIPQIVFHALTAYFIKCLALKSRASEISARRIGLAVFAYPELCAFCHFLWPETLHWALFAGALLCLTQQRLSFSVFAGLTLGLCLWFKSFLLPLVPILVILQGICASQRRVLHSFACGLPILLNILVLNMWMDTHLGPGARQGSGSFNLWLGLKESPKREWVEPIAGKLITTYDGWSGSWSDRARQARQEALQIVVDKGVMTTIWGQLLKQPFRLLSVETSAVNLMPGGIHGHQKPLLRDKIMANWIRLCHLGLLFSFFWAWPNLLAKNPLLGKTFACMVALYFGLFLVLHVKTRFFLPFVPLLLLKMGLDWRLPKKNQRIPLFVGGLILVWISIHGPFS